MSGPLYALLFAAGVALVMEGLNQGPPAFVVVAVLLLFGAGALLGAATLASRLVPAWVGWGIVVAAAAYPVSRIGNIAWLALIVDLVLLVCFAAIPFVLRERSDSASTPGRGSEPDRSPSSVSAAPSASSEIA